VDIDYLWRYNLYEHSRWGLGLAYNADMQQTWRLVANAGYGIRDRQFKWGLGGSLLVDKGHSGRVYLMSTREYAVAGNRNMHRGSIVDPGGLSSFMSLRMSDQISFLAGYRWRSRSTAYCTDVRLFYGGRLFDNNGLLYRKDGDNIVSENGAELRFNVQTSHFAGDVIVGHTWPAEKPVVQLLAEYDRTFRIALFDLRVFAQSGITTPNTPYIYMFDLGGCLGSPLYFRNSLLTVKQCEYTANAFILGLLRFGFEKPVFSMWNQLLVLGSNPRPFVGLSAAWGYLWGQDATGFLYYEGLNLTAPSNGLLEATVGIDGLLRWGSVDYGIATSVGLLPRTSTTRWAILLTAELSL